MTQNQLAYLKYAEDVRANKAKERAADKQAHAAAKQADVAEAKLYETSILGSKLPLPGIVYGAGNSAIHTSSRNANGTINPFRTIGDLFTGSLRTKII